MKRNHVLLRLIASISLTFVCATAQLPQAQKPKEAVENSPPSTPPGPEGASLPNANHSQHLSPLSRANNSDSQCHDNDGGRAFDSEWLGAVA